MAGEEHRWIAGPDDWSDFARRCADAAWLCIDTESDSMHRYREQVCLIQLSAEGELAVVDPLAFAYPGAVLDPIRDALAAEHQPVYLHGGEYDVVCLRRDFGVELRGVVDSQQGALLLGWEQTGYAALVERTCDVALPKAFTRYDWATRPLDPDALAYALDDVRYLPKVIDAVRAAIADADLVEEFAIANRAVEATEGRDTAFSPANIWRLKGVSKLPEPSLPVLVALHRWRDETARAKDVPAGRLLANDPLLRLAQSAPRSFGQLKRHRLKGWFLRAHGDELLATIKAALRDPPPVPERPPRREHEPEERERDRRLRDWRRSESERRGVTPQAVLPARAVDHLKRHGADDLTSVPQLGDKRIRLYGAKLRELAAVRKKGRGDRGGRGGRRGGGKG